MGDSAGLPVHRWFTRGLPIGPEGVGRSWELVQTYDARTLAPRTYHRWSGDGSSMRLRIDGMRITGVQHVPGEATPRTIDWTIDRPAFFAGASDLIPMSMEMRAGMVMTAPVWSPGMDGVEVRVFSVLGEERVRVEGSDVTAWRVEERGERTGQLIATWYLTGSSPYMVLGEVPLADGRTQRITGEANADAQEAQVLIRADVEDEGIIAPDGVARRRGCEDLNCHVSILPNVRLRLERRDCNSDRDECRWG
jgi:hypothetical protein